MSAIRTTIASTKKAISAAKGARTRLGCCGVTPTHRRLMQQLETVVRELEDELRGLKYAAEQERLSQQRQQPQVTQ